MPPNDCAGKRSRSLSQGQQRQQIASDAAFGGLQELAVILQRQAVAAGRRRQQQGTHAAGAVAAADILAVKMTPQ